MGLPVFLRVCLLLFPAAPLTAGRLRPGGDQGSLSTPDAPSAGGTAGGGQPAAAVSRGAAGRRHRPPASTAAACPGPARWRGSRAAANGTFADLATFRQALSDTFRTYALTALELPNAEVVLAPDLGSVTFLEVESTLDPQTLAQHTRLFRTTWQLQRTATGEMVTFSIRAVQRDGPLVQITTPGQVQAGALTRVSVTTPSAGFGLAGRGGHQSRRRAAAAGHGPGFSRRLSAPRGPRLRVPGAPAPHRWPALVLAHPYRCRDRRAAWCNQWPAPRPPGAGGSGGVRWQRVGRRGRGRAAVPGGPRGLRS